MNLEEFSKEHHEDNGGMLMRVAAIETRLAVAETRGDTWERRLRALYTRIELVGDEISNTQIEMRDSLDRVASTLREHVDKENEDRVKLMRAALVAMLGGSASLVGWFFTTFFERITWLAP